MSKGSFTLKLSITCSTGNSSEFDELIHLLIFNSVANNGKKLFCVEKHHWKYIHQNQAVEFGFFHLIKKGDYLIFLEHGVLVFCIFFLTTNFPDIFFP